MARRRRKRWTWFPILGAADVNEGGTDDLSGRVFAVPVDGSGTTNLIIFPLVPDVQTDPDTSPIDASAQLLLALSTDYEIERIVGKVYVSASGPADDVGAIAPKVVDVAVGLFIANQADQQSGGGAPDVPIGAGNLLDARENYNPLGNDTARQPWMWRRQWILSTGRPDLANINISNQNFQPIVSNSLGAPVIIPGAPTSNIYYGSVMDGPHIDCKVNRRVRSNQRLWCIAAARSLDRFIENVTPSANVNIDVKGLIDIRVLGAARKPTRMAAFA